MSANTYNIQAPDSSFVAEQVPNQRVFKKVKDVVKKLIVAQNSEMENIDFTDFEVAVNAGEQKLTLTLKSNKRNRYKITGDQIELTYNDIDFNAFMTTVLNIKGQYDESQLEAVKAALPVGLSHQYEESKQELTVTVDATQTNFDFSQENATLVTALFPGKTFKIAFYDDEIDIAEKLTVTALNIELSELVEPEGGVGA